mgnify:CR=1 FL=1
MSKNIDVAQTIEELRTAADAISAAADRLTKMFSGELQAANAPDSSPEAALNLEQVRAVLADKSRRGYTAEVKALLRQHGADKLSEIAPSEYEALLTEVEALGNG